MNYQFHSYFSPFSCDSFKLFPIELILFSDIWHITPFKVWLQKQSFKWCYQIFEMRKMSELIKLFELDISLCIYVWMVYFCDEFYFVEIIDPAWITEFNLKYFPFKWGVFRTRNIDLHPLLSLIVFHIYSFERVVLNIFNYRFEFRF